MGHAIALYSFNSADDSTYRRHKSTNIFVNNQLKRLNLGLTTDYRSNNQTTMANRSKRSPSHLKLTHIHLVIHDPSNLNYDAMMAIMMMMINTRIIILNLLTPNNDYSGRTAPLTSKCCILYIYSTNIGTEYFKHGTYSPFFPLQNAVCFINLTYFVPVLFTFYIQGVLKLK